MKLNTMKRLALSGLLALSVAGGTLTPVMAGHAAAGSRPYLCPVKEPCPIGMSQTHAGGGVDGGAGGGVTRDGTSKPGIIAGGMLRDGGSKPSIVVGSN